MTTDEITNQDNINAIKRKLSGAANLLYALAEQPSEIDANAIADVAEIIETVASSL